MLKMLMMRKLMSSVEFSFKMASGPKFPEFVPTKAIAFPLSIYSMYTQKNPFTYIKEETAAARQGHSSALSLHLQFTQCQAEPYT